MAKTTCRRAERRLVGLVGECEAEAGSYLNRPSDFLFTISRVENKAETIYTRPDKEHVRARQGNSGFVGKENLN